MRRLANSSSKGVATAIAKRDRRFAAQAQKTKKKAGRRRGHQADVRPPDARSRSIASSLFRAAFGPDCNVELVEPGQVLQYQTDLPPIVPIVTQFISKPAGARVAGDACRAGIRANLRCHRRRRNTFGPVVLTMGRRNSSISGRSYRKIPTLGHDCDLKVCPATFVRAEQRLASRARPTYDLLIMPCGAAICACR